MVDERAHVTARAAPVAADRRARRQVPEPRALWSDDAVTRYAESAEKQASQTQRWCWASVFSSAKPRRAFQIFAVLSLAVVTKSRASAALHEGRRSGRTRVVRRLDDVV